MKIDVFERIENENIDIARFVLDGVGVELANAFRRIILTEVPSMAITEVLFVENDGVLFDEMIAHRLGLIPLTTDLKNYNLPNECSCGGQGCTLCQAQLMCEVHAENSDRTVYSSDIEELDPKVHPVSDKIIIAKLGKGTSMVFEAYAQLGQGKDHAKFQPVSSVGYKYYPDVKIDNSVFSKDAAKRQEEMEKMLKRDFTHLFFIKDGKLAIEKDYWKSHFDFTRSIEGYGPPGAVKIDFVPNKFIFTVEGTGALPITEILKRAVEIFLEKCDEFEEQLREVIVMQKDPLEPEY
jgi:DNA-directed RNA polymerase subunit D